LHGFNNFPAINNLRQILLDWYKRIGLEPGYQPTLSLIISTKQLKKVHPGKAADLSNCLTYLLILLLPITTRDTKIQQG
jgi:hypothetical protein